MNKILIFLISVIFIGCSFRGEIPVADTDFNATGENFDIQKNWWEEFEDENLNTLIEKSLQNNSDLKLALTNLEKVEAIYDLSLREFLPNVGLSGEATRTRTSGETFSSRENVKFDNFSLTSVLSWELDLWGRVRNSAKAAKANFKASTYDYENAKISIAVAVAKSYFNFIALKNKVAIYEDTLKNYENMGDYITRQYKAGAKSEIEFHQSMAQISTAKAGLSTIQNALNQAKTALLILVGSKTGEILDGEFKISEKFAKIPSVPAKIPSEILIMRPDVASAYQKLVASNALVGVARANYFPKISLSGAFGFASDELKNLFEQNAQVFNFGGSLAMPLPLLDFGRTALNVDLKKIDQKSALINYEKVLRNALGETKNALVAKEYSFKNLQALTNLNESAYKIYTLAKTRYKTGYSEYLELLEAQRTYLNSQTSYIDAKLNEINSVIEIYRVFGGGFKDDTTK